MADLIETLEDIKHTFLPERVRWLKLDACRRCHQGHLRYPVFDTSAKLAMLVCPSCNYINVVQVIS